MVFGFSYAKIAIFSITQPFEQPPDSPVTAKYKNQLSFIPRMPFSGVLRQKQIAKYKKPSGFVLRDY
jgi:hypothetical protein